MSETTLINLIQNTIFWGGLLCCLSLQATQSPTPLHGIHQLPTLPSNPTFEQLTPVDGLSSSTVNYILQDQQGYIWSATNDGLNRYDGQQFLIFRKKEGLSSSITEELAEDQAGNIWIVTAKGVDILQPNQFRIHFLKLSTGQHLRSLTHTINKLCFTNEANTIFIGAEKGLFKVQYDADYTITSIKHMYQHPVLDLDFTPNHGLLIATKEGVQQYQPSENSIQSINDLQQPICTILAQEEHAIYMATFKGEIIRYQMDTQQKKVFKDKKQDWEKDLISELIMDAQHRLWMLSYGDGIHVLDAVSMELLHSYQQEMGQVDGLQTNVLECMSISQSGLLWTGTANGGINILNPNSHQQAFRLIQNNSKNDLNLMANGIHGIYVESGGTIVLAMDGGGLHFLQPNANHVSGYSIQKSFHTSSTPDLPSDHYYSIHKEGEVGYWFCNWDGLAFYNTAASSFENFYKKESPLGQAAVMTMARDSSGVYWMGTRYHGVASFSNKTYPNLAFEWYDTSQPEGIKNNRVEALQVDAQNQIWMGTMGGGIAVLSADRKSFTHYRHNPNESFSLSSDLILHFYQQNDSILWICTHGGGLNKMNLLTEQFTTYTTEDGLANNVVYAILPDAQGNLWMSTNIGISTFNPQTETFQNFDIRDGLQDNEFNRHAAFRGEDGTLYFGGINGLTFFNPDQIKVNNFIPPIVITEIKINQQAHPTVNQLDLDHDQNLLSFEFAALNYQQPSKNQYRYQLVGVDEDWIEGGANNAITYSHLSPGNYMLKVKGANNDGIWNEQGIELPIFIAPPWWATWWACMLYVLIAFTFLYLVYRFFLNKQLAEAEAARLLELDQLKTKLYTNITHEFRTPLTVIQGMAETLAKQPKIESLQKIGLIKKNSQQLLSLVNQLLDLSKLQAGKKHLNTKQDDCIAFLKYVTEAHESYAKVQLIDLQFYSEEEELVMDFDAQKMEQVLSNLISNAIKFTPAFGKILVLVKKMNTPSPQLEIRIIDNGIGMASEQLPHIFDRFHRVDDSHTSIGSGIGLALVKELVAVMKGTIVVKSQLHEGTSFLLTFPITQKALKEKVTASYTHQPPVVLPITMVTALEPWEVAPPLLLVIEDNIDVTYYLNSFLKEHYQVITASNGKDGVAVAFDKIPDIIISDVMMPEMNGYEVCHQLKTDERTNHIPIILLTAKTTSKDKVEGLQKGADAYLSKPFEQEELLVRLHKMLELRRLLQVKYSQTLLPPTTETSTPAVTDAFLQKAEEIILLHLSEDTFNGSTLAKALLLSRSQLYRKIKALTGLSTAIYIRRVRLRQAKQLLQQRNLSITEIAYQVGFKSPAYFSKAFKEVFGHSPRDNRTEESADHTNPLFKE